LALRRNGKIIVIRQGLLWKKVGSLFTQKSQLFSPIYLREVFSIGRVFFTKRDQYLLWQPSRYIPLCSVARPKRKAPLKK